LYKGITIHIDKSPNKQDQIISNKSHLSLVSFIEKITLLYYQAISVKEYFNNRMIPSPPGVVNFLDINRILKIISTCMSVLLNMRNI